MKKLVTYLNFNGNCREAMMFYQNCLGGTLNLQMIGEFPESENLPDHIKKKILHSSLNSEKFTIMASDIMPDDNIVNGNTVSIFIECRNMKEMKRYMSELSKGGNGEMNLKKTYWGTFFGSLTDKFNNNWLLHC